MPKVGRRRHTDDPPVEGRAGDPAREGSEAEHRRVLTAPDRRASAKGAGRKAGKGEAKRGAKAIRRRRAPASSKRAKAGKAAARTASSSRLASILRWFVPGPGTPAKPPARGRAAANTRWGRLQQSMRQWRRDVERAQPILLFLFLSCLTFAAYALWVTGIAERMGTAISAFTDRGLADTGLRIRTVTVSGISALPEERVMAELGVRDGMPLLDFDADASRRRLEALAWVRRATVTRLWPDRLHVDITERSAFALWQTEGAFYLIDRDGTILEPLGGSDLATLAHLPRVVGEGANIVAGDLVDLLDKAPALRSRLVAASRVADRRWNLRLDNGIVIRLPDRDEARAIRDIAALDTRHRLLARRVSLIDLRDPNVLVIRPAPGAEEDPALTEDLGPATGRRVRMDGTGM